MAHCSMVDVTVIGAGLAGLCCAVRLEQAGMTVSLLEAEDAPGGRIRTDHTDGFRLDHGFQFLLTDYPELPRHFDIKALRLRSFSRGALVWQGGRFHHFSDPFRGSLGDAMSIALDPVVPFADKLRVAKLRRLVHGGEPASLFRTQETTTRRFLEEHGFSVRTIERFFAPFLASMFLERELITSSRYFQFLFRMCAFGDAAVPEHGMEMLPRQLAVRLRAGTLQTGVRVTALRRNGRNFVVEAAREQYASAHVVLAVDDMQASTLSCALGDLGRIAREPAPWNRTTTFYYAAERAPIEGPWLALNGEGPAAGPVNHMVVVSQASERYAPPGAHLVAVNVVGRAPQAAVQIEQLERDVRRHLNRWFGAEASRWTVLGGYPIVRALPLCAHAEWEQSNPRFAEGLYVCGDARETPSIQGALASGRRVGEAVLHDAS